jgi:hypothetical protein
MDPFVIKATRVKTIKFENKNNDNKINFILNDLNNKNNFENENVLKNKVYLINDRPSKK